MMSCARLFSVGEQIVNQEMRDSRCHVASCCLLLTHTDTDTDAVDVCVGVVDVRTCKVQ
jgi:hypothetical protein